MSILRYGAYTHADGECLVSVLPSLFYGDGGPPRYKVEWRIICEMIAPSNLSGSAASRYLASRFQVMQAAYAQLGRNLVYEFPSGTLFQQILWNETIDGIRFEGPSWSPQDGEGATNMIVSITARAEVPVAAPSGIVSWREEVTMIGDGGPLVVWSEPLLDTPRPIQLRARTTYKAIHTCEAVGLTEYPKISPFFRSRPPLMNDPSYRRGSATNINGTFRNFPVSGQWQYESATPLILSPRSFA